MMDVYDLMRADRDSMWGLLYSVLSICLLLLILQITSAGALSTMFHLEDMRRLPETAPSVYEHFSSGNFSIKDKPGRFNAVGGDQKLEQSFNLPSKCSDH